MVENRKDLLLRLASKAEGRWLGLAEMEVSLLRLLRCRELCRLVPSKRRRHRREMCCLECKGPLEKAV